MTRITSSGGISGSWNSGRLSACDCGSTISGLTTALACFSSRSPSIRAQLIYEKEVSPWLRSLGEPTVRDYMKGKHFSHVRSVANSPGRAQAPSNVILEGAGKNLARGSRNMTGAELEAAKSATRVSTIKTGAKAAVRGTARAGLVAAAAEAPVSITENVLHFRRGRKSRKEAAKDAATSTAAAGGIGILIAAGAQASAMAGLTLGPFGAPLLICGEPLPWEAPSIALPRPQRATSTSIGSSSATMRGA